METLPKDLKKYLTSMLTSDEVVKLCSSSTKLRNICTNSDYNDVWISRIKKDFNIVYNGSNGYNEYMRLVINYNTQYWALIIYPYGSIEKMEIKLFPSLDHVLDYVYKIAGGTTDDIIEEINEVLVDRRDRLFTSDMVYELKTAKLAKPL